MFETLEVLPPDAILGLSEAFRADERPNKIDLGVGVYRTPDGRTPVMRAVAKAEAAVIAAQDSKAYLPPAGAPGFAEGLGRLIFGDDGPASGAERCAIVQTAGGCGALRIAAELLAKRGAERVLVGRPTWANHYPLLTAAGLSVDEAPYYDPAAQDVAFAEFEASLRELTPKEALLVHGGCHNPTGADLTRAQIDRVINLAAERGFLLFIDAAYHGFAQDLEADAYFIRQAVARLPEALITYSCSKNFGLYRERTGALLMLGETAETASALKSHALRITRGNYSMPPAHGGAIVAEILASAELEADWRAELAEMAAAVRGNRQLLADRATAAGLAGLDAVVRQTGMFSLLPLDREQVIRMREAHGVYLTPSGRINLCGVSSGNVDPLVGALSDVMR